MSPTEATAEVFLTAFRALSRKERQAVLARLASDHDLREDLHDLALVAQRRDEPSRPLRSLTSVVPGL